MKNLVLNHLKKSLNMTCKKNKMENLVNDDLEQSSSDKSDSESDSESDNGSDNGSDNDESNNC